MSAASTSLLLAAGLVLCTLASAPGEEPLTEKEVDDLVVQLVSPNKPPNTRGPDAEYPAGYDHIAQEKASAAWWKLRSAGIRTFPHLFKHLKDARYALTVHGLAADENYSVGSLCCSIVRGHLEPWGFFTAGEGDPRGRARRKSYLDQFKLCDEVSARTWWMSHKDKTLRELQLEALEWVVAEETGPRSRYPKAEKDHVQALLLSLKESSESLKFSAPFRVPK
jgi:hypothetical protein